MSTAITKMMKRVKFNGNVIWIVLLLFIATITGIAIADSKWIYFGIVLIPCLLYLCIEKPFIFPFGLYVFLLPFDQVLVLIESERGPTFTKFLGMLTILVFLCKGLFEKKLKEPDSVSISWLLFISFGMLTMLWAINKPLLIGTLPTSVGLIILYLVVGSYRLHRQEYEIIKWFIICGGLLAGLLLIYKYRLIGDSQRMSIGIGDRTSGLNQSAYAFIIPIAVCMEKLLRVKKLLMKVFFGVFVGIIVFSVILTGSRGGLLGVGALLIIFILSSKRKLSFLIMLILIGAVLASFIPLSFFERWGAAAETGGSGRFEIWYVGLKSLEKYWLFGAGLHNFSTAFYEYSHFSSGFKGEARDSHNLYIGTFVELGIIGFTLMTLAIIQHYRAIKLCFSKYNIENSMLAAALAGILVTNIFGFFIWLKSFWLIFMMIAMYRNVVSMENESRQSTNY